MITKIDDTNFIKVLNILTIYGREVRKDKDPNKTIHYYKQLIQNPEFELYYFEDLKENKGMSLINIEEKKIGRAHV